MDMTEINGVTDNMWAPNNMTREHGHQYEYDYEWIVRHQQRDLRIDGLHMSVADVIREYIWN